jgi:ABC-type phosphate/phosphonate transport system substrate-binding protein
MKGVKLAALFHIAGFGVAALGPASVAAEPSSSPSIAFVTVAFDKDVHEADVALQRYLKDKTKLDFDEMSLEYQEAKYRIANWPRGSQPYLARMTPYVYVAAEMLGADAEILATYNSKATKSTTYHSYFVVKREHFKHPNPTLSDLVDFLRPGQARFVYHDRFSTSSYFLPALYFRSQRIFAMSDAPNPDDRVIRLQATKAGKNSTDLVELVSSGQFDLAAVWDGTKQKVEQQYKALADTVYFIQLPDPVPNDLLVVSRWTPPAVIGQLRDAIRSMNQNDPGEIHTDDFRWWVDFKEADAARSTLANLRRIAAEHPAPVTVQIHRMAGPASERLFECVEAARQAIRLSGTEFVVFDEDSHNHKDVLWTLSLIHDGAVDLKTDIVGSELPPQQFQISFTDASDLTKRIGALIHSRMHRIRYIWPYEEKSPTIIRDVDFSIRPGTLLKARRITWLNPERNYFREGALFDAAVKSEDFYKFSLDETKFSSAAGDGAWASEPMSNSAYRVVLVRPSDEPFVFQALTVALVLIFIAAAAACTIDVRRREKASPQRQQPMTAREATRVPQAA